MKFTTAISIGLIVFSQTALPCSYIQLSNAQEKVSAQNFDFLPHTYNAIVVNKRNMEKSAGNFENMPAGAQPAKWISKYGSITFGYGLENPVTGVNEAGLTIYRFVFRAAKYPLPTQQPAIKESQYVQYILDTAKDVNEAIAQTRAVQIFPENFPTHFAICDSAANCAIVEAENGALNIYSGPDIKVTALTNDSYPASLEAWAKCPAADCVTKEESLWRFITAANQVQSHKGTDLKQGVLDILQSVNEYVTFTPTLWTMLTEISAAENKFSVKNTKSSNVVLSLDFKNLDYSCKTPVQVALLHSDDMAMSLQLTDYSKQFQTTISNALSNLAVPQNEIQKYIDYPEQYTRCLE